MLARAVLLGVVVALTYWCLGAFALFRRPGLPQTLRWVACVLVALWAGGFIQPIR